MMLLPPPRKQGNHGREDDAAEQQGVDAWAAKGRLSPVVFTLGARVDPRRYKSTLKARASSTMKGVVSTKSVTSLFPR